MNQRKALWIAAVAVLATFIVVGPALVPFGADPEATPTPTRPAPVSTRTSLAPTTTTTSTESEESGDGEQGSFWRQIDPTTLEDIAGTSALLLGEPGRSVIAPDSGTVVSFAYRSRDNSEELVIADLKRWEVLDRVPLEGWAANDASGVVEGPVQAAFLEGGDVLTWIARLPTGDPSEPVPSDFALYHYNLADARLGLSYRFPSGFAPWETRLLTGGRLAVFGSPVVYDEATPDSARWPRLLIVDAIAGSVERDIEIPGVVAGHEWKGESVGSSAHPGLGWDLAAERLYVAHANHLAIAVVDLARGEVIEGREINLPSSWREQLTLWLLPAAQAKLNEGSRRNVRIDPEGGRLYISGVRWELIHNKTGEAVNERQVAWGLTVLDLPTLDIVTHLDLPVSDVEISPDGQHLLLTGVSDGRVVDSDREQSGLYVLDADTLEVRGHLWPETIPWVHAFANEGQSLYATIWHEGASHLMLLDLQTMNVVAERRLSATEQSSFDLPRLGLTSVWAGK